MPRHNLPPAVVLPETLVHNTGRIIPGQFAGLMGQGRDPWFIEASPFDPAGYGAYPAFEFDHQERKQPPKIKRFEAPSLGLPAGFSRTRLAGRMSLLESIDHQRVAFDGVAESASLDRYRQSALSLLTDARVKRAFDVVSADSENS